jgi:hypothetical protein
MKVERYQRYAPAYQASSHNSFTLETGRNIMTSTIDLKEKLAELGWTLDETFPPDNEDQFWKSFSAGFDPRFGTTDPSNDAITEIYMAYRKGDSVLLVTDGGEFYKVGQPIMVLATARPEEGLPYSRLHCVESNENRVYEFLVWLAEGGNTDEHPDYKLLKRGIRS